MSYGVLVLVLRHGVSVMRHGVLVSVLKHGVLVSVLRCGVLVLVSVLLTTILGSKVLECVEKHLQTHLTVAKRTEIRQKWRNVSVR